jgi:hypothetical protein
VKRVICGAALLLTLTLCASASLLTGPPACASTTTLAALLSLGPEGCISQDKIYTGFTYSLGAADAADVNATLIFEVNPGFDIHGWTFAHTGSWTQAFTLSYNIEVAAGSPGVIFEIKDQINSGKIPNSSSVLDTQTPNVGPLVVLNPTGASFGSETVGATFTPVAKKINTVSTFSPGANGGILASYEQDWFEQNTFAPEPGTFALLGAGGLLVLVGRRWMHRKS